MKRELFRFLAVLICFAALKGMTSLSAYYIDHWWPGLLAWIIVLGLIGLRYEKWKRRKIEEAIAHLDPDRVNVGTQKTMVEKLYNDNPGMAMRIATGEEKAPNGILAAAVYAKVCSEAEKSDNLDMMMRIANSLHNAEISAESQKLKFRNPDSAIEKMKEVVNARREAFEKREGRTVKSAVQEEVENIKKAMNESKPTEKEFKDLVDSLGGDKK